MTVETYIDIVINKVILCINKNHKVSIQNFSNVINGTISSNNYDKKVNKILYVNKHLQLLKKFFDLISSKDCDIDSYLRNEILKYYKNENIIELLKLLPYKGFKFDEEYFYIYSGLEAVQLNMLDDENINNLVKEFLSSESNQRKTELITCISCKMQDILNKIKKSKDYFNQNKNDIDEYKCINDYFNINKIAQICNEFRHQDDILKQEKTIKDIL